jgi:hypothetical protein
MMADPPDADARTDAPELEPLEWPAVTAATRPWTRWWWMGDAVADGDLERELSRLDEVGIGGVEITPIYGVEGEEHRNLDFLGPAWCDRLEHVVEEATRRGMGVDAVPGTGWHFGGPEVGFEEATMDFEAETTRLDGGNFAADFDPKRLQTVVAYAADGRSVELTEAVGDDGRLEWEPGEGSWRVVSVTGRTSRDVKRATADRQGPMVSPYYPAAMRNYLGRFDRGFADYDGPPLRATFHDSFEFDAHWSPILLDAFEEQCGYRLQDHLPALLGEVEDDTGVAGEIGAETESEEADGIGVDGADEYVSRVRADYRRVLSRLYAATITEWTRWNHRDGRLARFQAHCAPGNVLELYELADVPETEFINRTGHVLGSKLASSAGHVSGSTLVSAETATWLDEHFTVTLARLKAHVDELFLAGVNHVVYHGTAYSPDDAPWPGWLFYAASQLNPRNPIWRDFDALNAYVARCQSVLQHGAPDADVLVYWPVEDVWHREEGFPSRMPILRRDWFESYSFGRVGRELRERGYSFDYVSDRQLRDADVEDGRVAVAGGTYETVVVPETDHAPLETVEALASLAEAGATVGFEAFPGDVPGLGDLAARRERLATLREGLDFGDEGETDPAGTDGVAAAHPGDGRVFVGDVADALARTDARREPLVDDGELQFVRRAFDGGSHYFLVNEGETRVERWVPLSVDADAVARLDPMTGEAAPTARRAREKRAESSAGEAGVGEADADGAGGSGTEVYLQLEPGESVVLRAFDGGAVGGEVLDGEEFGATSRGYWTDGEPAAVEGPWTVEFVRGGPERPPGARMDELVPWTELGDLHERFGGTARYETTFDRPSGDDDGASGDDDGASGGEGWWLDLGTVRDSATVWLNGEKLGTAVDAPFRLPVDGLEDSNTLHVEVTNRAANRVRDLDRRDVDWKRFEDINFVDRDYEPFDASGWDVRPAGLLGPVRLVPREPFDPREE